MSAYAKAIMAGVVGFIIAFLSALLPYVASGIAAVPAEGWIIATIAGLASLGIAGGAVYAVPNTPKTTGQLLRRDLK